MVSLATLTAIKVQSLANFSYIYMYMYMYVVHACYVDLEFPCRLLPIVVSV